MNSIIEMPPIVGMFIAVTFQWLTIRLKKRENELYAELFEAIEKQKELAENWNDAEKRLNTVLQQLCASEEIRNRELKNKANI